MVKKAKDLSYSSSVSLEWVEEEKKVEVRLRRRQPALCGEPNLH